MPWLIAQRMLLHVTWWVTASTFFLQADKSLCFHSKAMGEAYCMMTKQVAFYQIGPLSISQSWSHQQTQAEA